MLIKEFTALEPVSDGSFLLKTGMAAQARIYFVEPGIVRFKLCFNGETPEHSYALVLTAWDDELDALFKAERRRVEPCKPELKASAEGWELTSTELTLRIQRRPAGIALLDSSGSVLYTSLPERSFERDHLGRVSTYFTTDYDKDHYFGLGECSGRLDRRGRHLHFCPRDAIGADPECGMPLYKHIPFLIKTKAPDFKSLGIFFNNSCDALFDLGCERSGYWERYAYYQADGGALDLFFLAGPTVREVVRRYTKLTGTTALPPLHALGFTMSTMYYAELEEHCDEEIYKVVDKFRREGLPIDNFWLASGYSSGEADNKRYTFNWNKRRFPDPKGFFKRLEDNYVNVIPNLKPGVLTTHPYLEHYLKAGALIREPDGDKPYLGRWWGGPGYFVDFTGKAGREAWKSLLEEKILALGCSTVWNDNNEMDGVEDRTAKVSAEGRGGTMAEYKVIEANMMAYTAKEALAEHNAQLRPYIINRAGFAGIQRYAQVWGGDNYTSWQTLKYNVAMILGMGLSGCANMGCDIGGFTGPAPEAELMVRWLEQGVFQPRFVMNSANTDNTVTQPFMYPEYLPQIKRAFALRTRLMPYWYAIFHQAHASGDPIVRPLFYEFPHDARCYTDESLSFMLGEALLVANVLEKGAVTRTLYLPEGAVWYDLNDKLRPYEGGQTITVPAPLGQVPLFLRSGSALCWSDDLKVLKRDRLTSLHWLIAPGASGELLPACCVEDDGWSNAYLQGDYCRCTLSASGTERLKLSFDFAGKRQSSVTREELAVVSPRKGALFVALDGRPLKRFLIEDDYAQADEGWLYRMSDRTVRVKYARPQAAHYQVTVSTEHFDLIGMENNGGAQA